MTPEAAVQWLRASTRGPDVLADAEHLEIAALIEGLVAELEDARNCADMWKADFDRLDSALAEIEAESRAWADPTEKQVHTIMAIARAARGGEHDN